MIKKNFNSVCFYCGAEYHPHRFVQKYCSKSCRAKSTGVGQGIKTGKFVLCKTCGKSVWRKGYLLKKYSEFFCSRKCQGVFNGKRLQATLEKTPRYWMLGKNNWAWRGGITPTVMKLRKSKEMEQWRKDVFERDNFICVLCGNRGGKLQADHIKPFSLYPDLRFDTENGRTLCVDCHKKTDTYLSKVFSYL
jgi:hypothetical protein